MLRRQLIIARCVDFLIQCHIEIKAVELMQHIGVELIAHGVLETAPHVIFHQIIIRRNGLQPCFELGIITRSELLRK